MSHPDNQDVALPEIRGSYPAGVRLSTDWMNDHVHSVPASEPAADGDAVRAVLDRIGRCVTDVSLGFERWDDPAARGPGLYFVVVGTSASGFVASMGSNRWPVEDCATVFAEPDGFLAAAREVAMSRDGAVVVHRDGTIEESMVRVDQLASADRRATDDLPYAGWMGARHMSALETSTRDAVLGAITLSEEDGRVTVFTGGGFADTPALADD